MKKGYIGKVKKFGGCNYNGSKVMYKKPQGGVQSTPPVGTNLLVIVSNVLSDDKQQSYTEGETLPI